jgi:UDP-N-acetylglucosamine--dolichyl-phosphate N-acetylglucosaminephosphotransferase
MNLLIILISISFFVTYFTVPYWISGARRRGLEGVDKHKTTGKKIAESGGVAVLVGTCAGILLYIATNTFLFEDTSKLIYIFAILSVLLISTIVGLVDDLFGWKKGLSKKTRLFMIFFAAIPLMVINAGTSSMTVPFFGTVNFGLLYPLLIIPIGVIGATTTYNFLAGYNGLETSQGIIILSAMSLVTYFNGDRWLSVIALFMVASLFAFYLFNRYPAKVFPGDVLTYSVGSMIALIAILGNIEKIAVFFFIPYIIETALKSRGKLKKESFAKVNKDGSLEMPYEKIYGLEHLAIFLIKKFKKSKKAYEKEVVLLINGFQIVIIILGFLLFVI